MKKCLPFEPKLLTSKTLLLIIVGSYMLIDGTLIAQKIRHEIKDIVAQIEGRKPCLAVILVGSHTASQIYVNKKVKACKDAGIHSIKKQYPETYTEIELLREIERLNEDSTVDGILVQLPLPPQINSLNIIQSISQQKDVDGLHPINVGRALLGDPGAFIPCTPLGIKTLFEKENIDIFGKHVVIIGRSNLVGKPLASLLMQNSKGANATITVANSYTQDLKSLTRSADILIVAIGQAGFLTAEMVKEGAVVIDVGINKIEDSIDPKGYKIIGDADFNALKNHCSFITPVPGGVGPMTIAMLLSNTLKAYQSKIL